MLSEERSNYYNKLISDYTDFLSRTHPENFYTVQLKIADKNKFVLRTNEQHCLFLIEDAREQLKKD